MPKNGACNLSSINISEYIVKPFTEDAYIDFKSLQKDMKYIVAAMDDVIDENLPNHALKEQREMSERFRNEGTGVMGIHDALIKMGVVYGSDKSIIILNDLFRHLFKYAVEASVELAEERGNFPGYDKKVWDASILKQVFNEEEINIFKKKGKLRNSTLLSIAPTGSVGTMFNVSTGIEPWFSTHYTRNTKSLEGDKETSFEVWAPVIQEAMTRNWHPETYVCAADIPWKQHILVQGAAQKYVDTSISKTCNLPKGTTPEEIEELYIYAWKLGLKGCTIYVDGSRDPILDSSSPKEKELLKTQENELKMDSIKPMNRDDFGESLNGQTFKHKTACGTLYVTINKDKNGNIVEIFTNSSKNGTCKANLNGETRMASLALRSGVKVEEVIDQLKGIHCQSCAFARAKGNQVDGTSCPDIISKCILKAYGDTPKILENTEFERKEKVNSFKKAEITFKENDICPECGKPLKHEGGCVSCSCGFSRCG